MINYITNHSVEILAILGAVLTLATLIARLTPSKKDDTFIEIIRKKVESISNLFLPDRK